MVFLQWKKNSYRSNMAKVLFVCIHNAGKSQMAEAFLNEVSGGRHQGISAGSMPSDKINFVAVESMAELGINIHSARTKRLNT